MRLAEFIESSIEPIRREWVAFARSILPGVNMDTLALRDHASEILLATVSDMRFLESAEISGKQSNDENLNGASEKHAIGRLGSGFGLMKVVSEYRALRASVLRLWAACGHSFHDNDIADVGRFNASKDKSLEKAVSSYTSRIDQSRDMFLAILSHDLRNPLNSISVMAALLELVGNAAPQAAGAVSQISTNVNVMARMISDLLDYTRTRLGAGMPVNPVQMDLTEVCEDLIAEYRSAHPTKEIRMDLHGHFWGHWDSDRIRQAVSNLLGNAIQHSPDDAAFSLSVHGDESDVELVVWNAGSTISTGEMPNIFDPLIRVSSAGHPAVNRPGSIGLRLYMSCEILNSHGGKIAATSSETDGTAFTIELPREFLPGSGAPILDMNHIQTM